MKLFKNPRYMRLELKLTRRVAREEIVRRVYLSGEANQMGLAGIVRFDNDCDEIAMVLEGETGKIQQFLAFVRKSFGRFERLTYRFKKDKNEFDFVRVV